MTNDWFSQSCNHENCDIDPHYFELYDGYYWLKQGAPILYLCIDDRINVYCKNCTDKLNIELKPFLNTKLWVFK